MTTRRQLVSTLVACALILISNAFGAAELWDGSDSNKDQEQVIGRGNPLLNYSETTPSLNRGGNFQSPGAGYGSIPITAVPEPSVVAAFLGSIGLLALVRRRRG